MRNRGIPSVKTWRVAWAADVDGSRRTGVAFILAPTRFIAILNARLGRENNVPFGAELLTIGLCRKPRF